MISKADPAPTSPPTAGLDQAIDELISYLAEAADIPPAEAFSAIAEGRVLEIPARSDRPRPRLAAGWDALVRFVRRP